MKKHSDYITHIKNEEDIVYLKSKHFPVNMRLFYSSPEYKAIILQQCEYIKSLCLDTKEGYKKPHGMSSANAGLAFNIIGITKFRNQSLEFCQIMINPVILKYIGKKVNTLSNCGSLTLEDSILLKRFETVKVGFFNEEGIYKEEIYGRDNGSFTIQHEIDHNLGILITDY
jgi:peptide deformylase